MKFNLGGWSINALTRGASSPDRHVTLSPRAILLLEAFVHTQEATLTRGQLMDAIWPDVFVGDDSLTQVVAELRRKLGDPSIIKTVARTGYSLGAPVIRVVNTDQNSSPVSGQSHTELDAHALCLEARREMVLCGKGSIERACQLTAEAVELSPNSASVRAEHAIALVRKNAYWSEGADLLPDALFEAHRAVSLDPKLAIAHSALGYAHSMSGQVKKADAAHRTALELGPRDAVVCHNAAWHLMSRGRYRSAISFFEQVSDLEPTNIKGNLIAAQLCGHEDTSRGRRNAERALQRARARLEVDPNDSRALTASATLMAMLGEPNAAFLAMENIDIRDSALAIYHASAMAQIGETSRAVDLFEELFDHGWRDLFWLDADPSLAAIQNRQFRRMRQQLKSA